MTVFEAQVAARAAGLDRLDTQLLLSRVLDRPRTWLLAHDDARLDASQRSCFEGWVARRAAGEPVAYLFGEKEFHGLMLTVDASVLVPRPDTETLVEWALEVMDSMRPAGAPLRVIDLGTGSGAVALAVKHARPGAAVSAVDASPAALRVASANANRLHLDIEFLSSDWLLALGGRRFDLVVSNPPYIASDDEHLAALTHEPLEALASGTDGLDDIRRIVDSSSDHLQPGGWLLLEHGADQAAAVCGLLRLRGFEEVGSRHDLAGQARCSGGRRA
ncbi:MAG: protein-(glutamine-N5) methyltransferase, release factor-specific [Rhizobacter sp.]|nr:protein-(glutamine-N5) methyltransferase, release factor-specific [Rhizobacter sp.]